MAALESPGTLVKHILMVEDNPDTTEDLRQSLSAQGFYVRTLRYEKALEGSFADAGGAADVAILDWMLGTDEEGRTALGLLDSFLSSGVVGVVVYTEPVNRDEVAAKIGGYPESRVRLILKENGGVKGVLDFIQEIESGKSSPLAMSLQFRSVFRNAMNVVVSQVCGWKDEVIEAIRLMAEADNSTLDEGFAELFSDLTKDQASVLLDSSPAKTETAATAMAEVMVAPPTMTTPKVMAAPTPSPATKINTHLDAWRLVLRERMYDRSLPPKDRIRLGDVFVSKAPADQWKYRVAVTPRCELASADANDKIMTIEGFSCDDHNSLCESISGRGLKYVTMPDVPVGTTAFDNIKFVFLSAKLERVSDLMDIEKWTWIARIRTPYVDDLVQSYAKYYLRIGVPGHPWGKELPDACKELCKRVAASRPRG